MNLSEVTLLPTRQSNESESPGERCHLAFRAKNSGHNTLVCIFVCWSSPPSSTEAVRHSMQDESPVRILDIASARHEDRNCKPGNSRLVSAFCEPRKLLPKDKTLQWMQTGDRDSTGGRRWSRTFLRCWRTTPPAIRCGRESSRRVRAGNPLYFFTAAPRRDSDPGTTHPTDSAHPPLSTPLRSTSHPALSCCQPVDRPFAGR